MGGLSENKLVLVLMLVLVLVLVVVVVVVVVVMLVVVAVVVVAQLCVALPPQLGCLECFAGMVWKQNHG